MQTAEDRYDHLVDVRRDLHRHPEPALCEFYTTARIVEELERIGVDEIHVGPDALAEGERMAIPDDETIAEWYERALADGAEESIVEQLQGGFTGAVAVVEQGDGPTVGLRVDIDGLLREESDDPAHLPAAEGFRSENEGAMHACGHDAHTVMGLGVIEAMKASDFAGTLKVFFQPGEERAAGGKAMAESGHLDDVDYLLAVHVGLDHPTGEVVAGVDGFLAISNYTAEFTGESAHAGGKPNAGRNAIQAMTTAVQNLYAIPRHEDGATRINVGKVGGGTATNIICEEAFIECEVRGETTELMEYMRAHADRIVESAARMHDCEVTTETVTGAPSATSDEDVADVVSAVAHGMDAVDTVLESDDLGGSEDATQLMNYVQERGGLAAYVGVGTDHPGGHHTATFDVDEASIPIAVELLADSLRELAEQRP